MQAIPRIHKIKALSQDFKYSMLPIVAGGTSFMYNLSIGKNQFKTLNLSQETLAKIFSGQIDRWDDAAIAADNQGVALPAQRITVVVRSDGSGATAQFTLWMLRTFPQHYATLCAKMGCNPSSGTSYFATPPSLPNFVGQSGSIGVTQYTKSNPFTINYDEYSYALNANYPVVNIKNAAGFYVKPTAENVAVALVKAKINQDPASKNYLAQDLSEVYGYQDPRTYPLSAYSYMIVPAQTTPRINASKGSSIGFFASYSLCEGQLSSGKLGYSPLPMNLVLAAMDQVRKVPGLDDATTSKLDKTRDGVASGGSNPCNNPTFKPGDNPNENQLVYSAPFPSGCDAACQAPWKKKGAGANNGPGTAGNAAGPKAPGAKKEAAAGDAPTTDAPAAAADTPQDCDPDTGVCAGASPSGSGNGAGGPLTAVPSNLTSTQGWGQPQTLLVIIGLLVVLLVLAPPLTARMVGRSRRDEEDGL